MLLDCFLQLLVDYEAEEREVEEVEEEKGPY